MKSRPILFSGPMARAILSGQKTQTRRVVKSDLTLLEVRSTKDWANGLAGNGYYASDPSAEQVETKARQLDGHLFPFLTEECGLVAYWCPYGKPGDHLWVREEHYKFGHWEPVPGVKTKTGKMKWRFVADSDDLRFDPPDTHRKGRHHKDPATPAWHKRLARFMPRSYSRIDLEITGVSVEHLQDISEEDAKAEGVTKHRWFCPLGKPDDHHTNLGAQGAAWNQTWDDIYYKNAFANLWESINGPCSWDANPWVWVIEFRRIKP